MVALQKLPGGDKFDTILSIDAVLLQRRLGMRVARATEEDGQRQVKVFFSHSAEVQCQLLKLGNFLGAKIENHVGLAAIAGCWARLEVRLPEMGSLEETRFTEWISVRATAYTLATIFRCGPRAMAELLKCAKDSTEVSQMRFYFVELLVNDQAEAGEGELDMAMMMCQAIGFHTLTFANTKKQAQSLLKFWRCQSADNHMVHFKRFVGIQE